MVARARRQWNCRRLAVGLVVLLQLTLMVYCVVEEEPVVRPPPKGGGYVGGGGRGTGSGGSDEEGPYVPGPYYNSLGVPADSHYCDLTHLNIDEKEFEKRCGDGSDPKWPCFTHLQGNLSWVDIEPWLDPMDPTKDIIVKDSKGIGQFRLAPL